MLAFLSRSFQLGGGTRHRPSQHLRWWASAEYHSLERPDGTMFERCGGFARRRPCGMETTPPLSGNRKRGRVSQAAQWCDVAEEDGGFSEAVPSSAMASRCSIILLADFWGVRPKDRSLDADLATSLPLSMQIAGVNCSRVSATAVLGTQSHRCLSRQCVRHRVV